MNLTFCLLLTAGLLAIASPGHAQNLRDLAAWPAVLGRITVDAAMAAAGGTALSAVNLTGKLTAALRDKSPSELRQMNRDLLIISMGISSETADAFLYNSAMVRITQLEELTVCLTRDGVLVIPIQWDYVAWTPGTASFLTALKAQKFGEPVSGYSLIVTGATSPLADQALSARGVKVTTKALPGPLR